MSFPTEDARLEALEVALRRRLPAAYRASMIRANGGYVDALGETWWLHPVFDDGDRRRLKRTCMDVLHETREAHGLPDGALAIANNGAGDYLVLLPTGSTDFGETVYRLEHEGGGR